MQRRHAFSLIELSIAVFIIAIIIAVALPSFVRSYNQAVLNETARTFATTCLLGRVQAVTQQKPATLHIDLEHQMFWLTQTSGTGEEQTLKTYQIDKRVQLASGELVDGSAKSGGKLAEILFYPNGTCDSITVVFRSGERGGVAATLDPITCQANPYPVK